MKNYKSLFFLKLEQKKTGGKATIRSKNSHKKIITALYCNFRGDGQKHPPCDYKNRLYAMGRELNVKILIMSAYPI